MKLILRNVTVLSPGSQHHMKVKDILITEGVIQKIADANSIKDSEAKEISGEELTVSSGWFDLHANFKEPGHEYKEGISNGCKAAANGGFTGVLLMPSVEPATAGRPQVEFIINKSKNELVNVIPAGALSVNRDGKDMSEMYDMYQAGAKVFTDDKRAIQDAGLLIRTLQYANNFGGKIFVFAEEKSIAGKNQVNEGPASTLIGLKGQPNLAEEVMINRDLYIAEYTHCPIHFSTISTAGSVQLIREAKAKGIKVTCDVAVMHLYFNDQSIGSFDSNFKIKPPLRSEADRLALLEGLKDGTIDCICSDHQPEDVENKLKEFELAAFGASTIDTAFAAARTATIKHLSLAELVSKFTLHARCIAGSKNGLIEEGQPADLTFFEANKKWKVELKDISSKSKSNPFIGLELTGKVKGVFNRNKLQLSGE